MVITYDPDKRARTLEERGLDFEDAPIVFAGLTVEVEDTRKDYGEVRMLCYGKLEGRLVVIGYTPRGADRHIFSMRKANRREQDRLAPYFGVGSEAR
ncbi:MAG: BrnT family toxin [Steroidobacteraceae bacterium]